MDDQVDHYVILGLPSGEEGAKLSIEAISKAYRKKALELHPDKRPGDKEAHANFQQLVASNNILKDEKARKSFDDLLRVKLQKVRYQSQRDSKRQKMMSDLEKRERDAFAVDPVAKARKEEEKVLRKFNEEVARVRAEHANKDVPRAPVRKQQESVPGKGGMDGGGSMSDKEKVLKVSWEFVGEDYSAEQLREVFEEFGKVEDVLIRNFKRKRSAFIVMASKEAAVDATTRVCGKLSNPLLVMPVQPNTKSPVTPSCVEPDGPELSNLAGPAYPAFEDSVLNKLRMAADRQKMNKSS